MTDIKPVEITSRMMDAVRLISGGDLVMAWRTRRASGLQASGSTTGFDPAPWDLAVVASSCCRVIRKSVCWGSGCLSQETGVVELAGLPQPEPAEYIVSAVLRAESSSVG